MPAETKEPPKVDLFADTGILDDEGARTIGQSQDVDGLDGVSQTVGRQVYLSPYDVQECLLPALCESELREPAVFDRYYPATDDAEAVLVDVVLSGGEPAEQEATKQVAFKRRWCKKQGVKYLVVVDDESWW